MAKKKTNVQSIIFDKQYWTITSAKRFLRAKNYVAPKVDETVNFYRFRQFDPNKGKHYFTKPSKKYPSVKYVIEI